jgi:hypothetical protein
MSLVYGEEEMTGVIPVFEPFFPIRHYYQFRNYCPQAIILCFCQK